MIDARSWSIVAGGVAAGRSATGQGRIAAAPFPAYATCTTSNSGLMSMLSSTPRASLVPVLRIRKLAACNSPLDTQPGATNHETTGVGPPPKDPPGRHSQEP